MSHAPTDQAAGAPPRRRLLALLPLVIVAMLAALFLARLFAGDASRIPSALIGQQAPPIDLSEDEKAYRITAELPGLDAKDVELSVSDGRLILKGEKRREKEEKEKNYYFSERAYGSFQRVFELPASVEHDKITADFSKGVLTITLPKTAEAQQQAKKIEIKSA